MRGRFAGGTDYSLQSFEDIVADLEDMAANFCRWGLELSGDVRRLVDAGYWESVPTDFQGQVARVLKLLDTACGDLKEIAVEARGEVVEHHSVRLRKLAQAADDLNRTIGEVWHADYMTRFKAPQYGEEQFMLLERVYADGRDSVVTLLDLDAMGARLADYVGRSEPESWVQRARRLIAENVVAAVFAVIVAGFLVWLGWN